MMDHSSAFRDWVRDNQPVEAYRFDHTPTFHRPLAMTLWLDAAGGLWLDIRLGAARMAAEKALHRPLDPAAWEMLREALARCSFWGSDDWSTEWGRDGSVWAFAGLREGRTHSREVWSPEPGTPAHGLGWAFFNLVPPDFCPVITLAQFQEMARRDPLTPGVDVVVVY